MGHQDAVDFADGISDGAAGRRLSESLQGKGAFRRFRNEVYEHHAELISAWQAMRDARARVRAVQWLVDEGLVDEEAAQRFTSDNPELPSLKAGARNGGSTTPGCLPRGHRASTSPPSPSPRR